MADAEDKEKAEKLAAARKRYDQLKKQKDKKGGGAKKEKKAKGEAVESAKATDAADEDAKVEDAAAEAKNDEGGEVVDDLQKQQASRIEELEEENERLSKQLQEKSSTGDTSTDVETLKSEVASLKRQNSQLEARKRRTSSFVAPDTESLNSQLASKSNTIDSLELELSNLRHSLSTTETRSTELEAKVNAAEESTKAAEQRLTDLKTSLESAKDSENKSSEEDTRIALLNSDLSAAQQNASSANTRADALEKKVETLNTLHREAESRFQTQSKQRQEELDTVRAESADLRRRLRGPHARKSVDGDGGGVEELEDEERSRLQARVRQLEGELFDARRGVWRERRKEMQGGPGPTDEDSVPLSAGSFDDVDLNAPSAGAARRRSESNGYGSLAQNFQNVFNTFTGTAAGAGGNKTGISSHHPSVGGGFSDEDDFDEAAFAAAQEAEAKARLERVKEIKRGLGGWKGWRVDMVDVRGGAMAGVFDV
ncbi:MAG: hypothetical protein M1831_006986 [Alyxoria varia]|nr:MAG: hypothetical protein M1831_006986 [Alyxoria varia]